jgi:hypothetical protein
MSTLRKYVTFAVIFALALANGFVPPHAVANPHLLANSKFAHHQTKLLDHVRADNEHGHGANAHHDAEVHTNAKNSCAYAKIEKPRSDIPLHSCCVSSCYGVAFVIPTFTVGFTEVEVAFPLPLVEFLTSASLDTSDPPPR